MSYSRIKNHIFFLLLMFLVFIPFLPACAASDIQAKKNIPYLDQPGKNPNPKQMLDVYYQKDWKNKPVFMFIHGGGWTEGDKSRYEKIGKTFANKGFVTVVISYRLSPQVVHPAHIKDCAAAFAWVHKNIASYGGDPKNIFVSGHSAGGHLTALLTLDPRYLKVHNLTPSDIRAAIPISGVYNLESRQRRGIYRSYEGFYDTMRKNAFGTDKKVWKEASPITYVKKTTPPMLIIYGGSENPFNKSQSKKFHEALIKTQAPAELKTLPGLNHFTEIIRIGSKNDITTEAIVEFIKRQEGSRE